MRAQTPLYTRAAGVRGAAAVRAAGPRGAGGDGGVRLHGGVGAGHCGASVASRRTRGRLGLGRGSRRRRGGVAALGNRRRRQLLPWRRGGGGCPGRRCGCPGPEQGRCVPSSMNLASCSLAGNILCEGLLCLATGGGCPTDKRGPPSRGPTQKSALRDLAGPCPERLRPVSLTGRPVRCRGPPRR